jgi:hypothetical protein
MSKSKPKSKKKPTATRSRSRKKTPASAVNGAAVATSGLPTKEQLVLNTGMPGTPILINGRSLADIGRDCEVTESYISRLLKNTRTPSLGMLDKLVPATGLSWTEVRIIFAPDPNLASAPAVVMSEAAQSVVAGQE